MGYNTDYKKIHDDEESLHEDFVKPSPTSTPRRGKKGKSCLTWCLIIVGAMIALSVLLATVMFTMAFIWMKHEVIRFTVTERLSLPIHALPDSELDLVKDRAMLFLDTLKAGQVPANDLTLSVDEFNGFIAHSDFLRGNAIATVSENEVSVDLSLPAKFLPGGKKRYLVGNWYVGVSQPQEDKALITTKFETFSPVKDLDGPILFGEFLTYWQNSELVVNLQSGQFLKWIAPQKFMDKKRNLLKDIYDDDDCPHHAKRVIEGIRGVSIDRNGDIVIQAKRSADDKLMTEDDEAVDAAVDAAVAVESTTTSMHHGRRLLAKLLF
jgi:hypothetical protein